jgi:hypothetical protein
MPRLFDWALHDAMAQRVLFFLRWDLPREMDSQIEKKSRGPAIPKYQDFVS